MEGMAENFLFSVNSVFPVFIVIALGFFMRIRGFTDMASIKKMNGIVFNFAVPLMLFRDIYKSDFSTALDVKLILYSIGSTFLIFIVIWAAAARIIKNKRTLGAFVQGCFRGNYAIIGMSLVTLILGSEAAGKAAVITTFVIPLYNILAVVVLTCTAQHTDGSNVIRAVKNICRNPLIIGIAAGIPFSVFNISLPSAAETSVGYMAQLATPLALIAIGGSIDFKRMMEGLRLSLCAVLVKLVFVPCVFLGIAYFIGLGSAEDMIILYVLYASPTAVNSYIMAANMGSDEQLASNIILMTTIFSVFTFTAGVYILRCTGIL